MISLHTVSSGSQFTLNTSIGNMTVTSSQNFPNFSLESASVSHQFWCFILQQKVLMTRQHHLHVLLHQTCSQRTSFVNYLAMSHVWAYVKIAHPESSFQDYWVESRGLSSWCIQVRRPSFVKCWAIWHHARCDWIPGRRSGVVGLLAKSLVKPCFD